MRRPLAIVLAALWAAVLACAASAVGDRLLVVLDDVADAKPYSHFFGDLEARGFKITYETPKSESVTLFYLGERTYDHVVFFPTKVKGLGPNLTPQTLLHFVNAQGNILLAQTSSKAAPSSLVSFLAELDVAFPPDRSGLVVDHFSHDVSSDAAAEAHDVVLLSPQKSSRKGVKAYFSPEDADAVLAYPHGMGHVLGQSPLLTPVLRAPRTAYLYDPKEQADRIEHDELFAAGAQLGLVSVFQARNAGRVAILGAVDMLADEWFDADVWAPGGEKSRTWNREFARRLAGWTFHEIGVLRVNAVDHYLVDGEVHVPNPEIYRIKTESIYTVSISEWEWDHWTPYVAPEDDDLQLEFSMLSPYQRLNLVRATDSPPDPSAPTTDAPPADAATYFTRFRLPDQHGIFNFMLNYKRPLLTPVEEKRTVSVRHMAHDEWPRSWTISGAWPWISGVGVTMGGFLAFSVVWMFNVRGGNNKGGKRE